MVSVLSLSFRRGFFVISMVMTLLSLAALSMMGPYQYVLADWQLAYRAISSAQDRDQCLQAACGSSPP
ncbi:hypothetical protein N9M28_06395 [Luminiphilus sp.]|nr:hypothetical protein [Luminiphilus sp.]MDA9799097.1 hypothetical protein [Luminiphilus sp.]